MSSIVLGYHKVNKEKHNFCGVDSLWSLVSVALLVALTLGMGFILGSQRAKAETNSASAAVIVADACSLTSTTTSPHTATISPSLYQAEIGSTTLKASCNDSGGFSIYAVGYSDSEFGKTTLTANIGGELIPANDIVTGTNQSGTTSNWAMKLATNPSATYPVELKNSYDDYNIVPSTFTLVAVRNAGTDSGTGATGAEVTATYAAYVAAGQPAGKYSGRVKYTMVHPSNEVPLSPQPSTAGCITYYTNASDAQGTMGTQCNLTDGASITLYASNFSRTGYGFAGWSDAFDYATNPNAHFYGPQEDITVPEGTTENGLSLYAVWVKSTGSLQDTNKVTELCGTTTTDNILTKAPTDGTANLSSVSALTDQRDNQTYAIAKLADGKCWMIENLRLDNQYTVGNNQTDPSVTNASLSQGYNPSFIGLADPESANFDNVTTTNSLYTTENNIEGKNTISGDYQAQRFPRYNNDNTSQRSANTTNTNVNTYSYGNYYTWHAVIADITHHRSGNYNTTSICPTGWHIPTGNRSGEYYTLNTNANSGSTSVSTGLRSYPTNFLYSGHFYDSSAGYRGSNGYYLSSTGLNAGYSYSLYLGSSRVYPGTNDTNKFGGLSARCVLGS
ncbi:hypothetical protein IKF04_04390 [Candidatus Saccharibacteria bacterium]|nr:hypothetical protein [Candidatus Saccharibacteria bacterium]